MPGGYSFSPTIKSAFSSPEWARRGNSCLRAVRLDGESVYRIVGFLSDNDESVGLQIEGIPIVGTLDQTCRLVSLYKVQKVLVVQGEFPGINLKKLIHEAEERPFHGPRDPRLQALDRRQHDFPNAARDDRGFAAARTGSNSTSKTSNNGSKGKPCW